MKREELLEQLGFQVPTEKQVRVIIHSDVKNEADDAFAILHSIMTPSFEICGIIAAHFEGRFIEWKKQAALLPEDVAKAISESSAFFKGEGTSMQQSYDELKKILDICNIEDIPFYKGCSEPLQNEKDVPDSEGVQCIIEEALKEDSRPLYVLLQGNLTDLAAAIKREPEIAGKFIAVWIGGEAYPDGGAEFNIMQDTEAARIVFNSNVELWQIPSNVYSEIEVTFAELIKNVKSCGDVGKYLFDSLMDMNKLLGQFQGIGRNGENWCLGDQPVVGVLLQNKDRACYHTVKAPLVNEQWNYSENPSGREIRVYDAIDTRLLLEDFYAKLQLCFGRR